MARLTVRGAFQQLLELAGRVHENGVHVCCICRDPLLAGDNYHTIRVSFPRYELAFNVCVASCAYELGHRTAPALALLLGAPVCAVPSDRVPVRGSARRPTRTSGPATGVRRKNTTPASKGAKQRG